GPSPCGDPLTAGPSAPSGFRRRSRRRCARGARRRDALAPVAAACRWPLLLLSLLLSAASAPSTLARILPGPLERREDGQLLELAPGADRCRAQLQAFAFCLATAATNHLIAFWQTTILARVSITEPHLDCDSFFAHWGRRVRGRRSTVRLMKARLRRAGAAGG